MSGTAIFYNQYIVGGYLQGGWEMLTGKRFINAGKRFLEDSLHY